MSMLSQILSELEYVTGMRCRIPFMESGLAALIRRVPSVRLGGGHEFFSLSFGNEFSRDELGRRAINESVARMPIAR
jgi:hypothetical protein